MGSRFNTTLLTRWRNELMRTNTAINTSRSPISSCTLVAAIALMVLTFTQLTLAQEAQPKTFASASQAAQALYEAVKGNDESGVDAILGCGHDLTSSGSDPEDKLNHERFVQKYQEMHRFVREPDGTMTLYIGAENWPFPFPLVSKDGQWSFDSDAGSQEVLAREIGRNEVTAVQICMAFQELRGPHVQQTSGGDPIREFAASLASGRDAGSADSEPFHGYHFRRVAAGKSSDALLVAYPAEYRSSGVMTFVITGRGLIYEKDLGPQTATAAQQVQGRPAKDWVAMEQ